MCHMASHHTIKPMNGCSVCSKLCLRSHPTLPSCVFVLGTHVSCVSCAAFLESSWRWRGGRIVCPRDRGCREQFFPQAILHPNLHRFAMPLHCRSVTLLGRLDPSAKRARKKAHLYDRRAARVGPIKAITSVFTNRD